MIKQILILLLLLSVPASANLISYGTFQLSGDYPNLLDNGDFSDNLDDWTKNIVGIGSEVTEVGANELNGGAGSGAANMFTSDPATGMAGIESDSTFASGNYLITLDTNSNGLLGSVYISLGSGSDELVSGRTVPITVSATGTGISPLTINNTAPWEIDFTVDNIFVRRPLPWSVTEVWDLRTDGVAKYGASSNDGRLTMSQSLNTTEGKLYKVQFTVSEWTSTAVRASLRYSVSSGTVQRQYGAGTVTGYTYAGPDPSAGLLFRPFLDETGDTFKVSSVSVRAVTLAANTKVIIVSGASAVGFLDGANEATGPNGNYTQTTTIQDGRNVWASDETHPTGDGVDALWYLWYDTDRWVIGIEVDTSVTDSYWTSVSVASTPTNLTYTEQGEGLGSAITFNGESTPRVPPAGSITISSSGRY